MKDLPERRQNKGKKKYLKENETKRKQAAFVEIVQTTGLR